MGAKSVPISGPGREPTEAVSVLEDGKTMFGKTQMSLGGRATPITHRLTGCL